MRGRPTLLVAFGLLLAGLASCSGDDSASELSLTTGPARTAATTTSASTSTPGSTPDDGFPVTVEHAGGTTTFEERPERIVTLNVQWTDAVLAFDVEPVAFVLDQASLETGPYPWQDGRLDGSVRIDVTGTVPYERIAELDPDLILVTFLAVEQADLERLRAIAPTIGLLGDLEVDTWQSQVEVIGQVLGETQRAAEITASVEDQIEALADELPGLAGKTYVAANYVPGDSIYVVADPDDGASRLFYALGMEIDPDILALDTQAVGRIQISLEQTGLLDADFLGVLAVDGDPADLPGWDQLTAVRSGAVVDFEFADVVGLNTPSALSIPYVIELMRPALQAAAAT